MTKAAPITDALAFAYKTPKVSVDWFDLGGILSEQKTRHIRDLLTGFAAAAEEDNPDLADTLSGIIDDHFAEDA